ncbi:hypothetical protein [Acinetobacter ursingii]|nr:hypothetical protein [Acinetobacter ursingii]
MYITLITLFLILGIFLYLNKKRKSFLKKTYAEKFVNDLEALNYFKYTSQLDYLNVKKYFIENFDPQGELCTQWDEKKGFSKDYR